MSAAEGGEPHAGQSTARPAPPSLRGRRRRPARAHARARPIWGSSCATPRRVLTQSGVGQRVLAAMTASAISLVSHSASQTLWRMAPPVSARIQHDSVDSRAAGGSPPPQWSGEPHMCARGRYIAAPVGGDPYVAPLTGCFGGCRRPWPATLVHPLHPPPGGTTAGGPTRSLRPPPLAELCGPEWSPLGRARAHTLHPRPSSLIASFRRQVLLCGAQSAWHTRHGGARPHERPAGRYAHRACERALSP